MSTKRPSKQKRQAQNRAQRAALEARRQNVQAMGSGSGGGRSAGRSGGLLSRFRLPPRSAPAATPAPAAADATSSPRTPTAPVTGGLPPGHRAATSALMAAVAAALVATVLIQVPVDREGDLYSTESRAAEWAVTALDAVGERPDDPPAEVAASIDDWSPRARQQRWVQALWPWSLTLVLPLLGAYLGYRTVKNRAAARVVNRAMFATLFGALLTQSLFLLFLPTVIAIGVAGFQVRKAEVAAARVMAAGATDDTAQPPGDVIDTDVVDDSDVTDDGPADDERTE